MTAPAAGMVADAGAGELLEEGYVREVFVAQEQPSRPRSLRLPDAGGSATLG